MREMNSRFKTTAFAQDVIVDGETLLFDIKKEEFLGLNGVATEMWILISKGSSIIEILKNISSKYNIDIEKINSDLSKFIDILIERELIEEY